MKYHSRTKIRPMRSLLINVLHALGIRPNTGLGSQIRNTMRALGYSTDPETWI